MVNVSHNTTLDLLLSGLQSSFDFEGEVGCRLLDNFFFMVSVAWSDVFDNLLHVKVRISVGSTAAFPQPIGKMTLHPAWLKDDLHLRLLAAFH